MRRASGAVDGVGPVASGNSPASQCRAEIGRLVGVVTQPGQPQPLAHACQLIGQGRAVDNAGTESAGGEERRQGERVGHGGVGVVPLAHEGKRRGDRLVFHQPAGAASGPALRSRHVRAGGCPDQQRDHARCASQPFIVTSQLASAALLWRSGAVVHSATGAYTLLVLPVIAGSWLGARVFRTVSNKSFGRLVMGLTAMSGLALVLE